MLSPSSVSAPAVAPARILVVDDEADIREPMELFLRSRGFEVGTAADGEGLHSHLASEPCDLVLLDVMLPGQDGFELCRQLQERRGPPVILLTAMGEASHRVRGLETGADDYVVKPFDPGELLARIRNVLRRTRRAAETRVGRRFRFGPWQLDTMQQELQHQDGRRVPLSSGEARLLSVFVVHPREVLSRDRLLDLCGAADASVFDRSIDSHISRLRRKLEADSRRPRLLKTEWGQGYLLAADVEDVACAVAGSPMA